MKPVYMRLCGWGPYREEQHIDFERLASRGLFLVTGDTGAGKTTIFDAITYAVYGDMSGQLREKNTVRSDFADENTPTFVELTLTHRGETYQIYRNPEYMRPRKRALGAQLVREKENALLTMPDGSRIEGSVAVTRRMEQILSMDSRQFKQISMIAQGEFVRLLTALPKEKMQIFRDLFDTSFYERVGNLLRRRAIELAKEMETYRHKMDEDVANYMAQDAQWQPEQGLLPERLIEELKGREKAEKKRDKELQAQAADLAEKLEQITERIAGAEQVNAMFAEAQLAGRLFEQCLGRKEEMEQKRRLLERARSAEKVALIEERHKLAKKAWEQEKSSGEKLKRETEELSRKRESLSVFFKKKDDLASYFCAGREFASVREETGQSEEALSQTEKRLEKLQMTLMSEKQQTDEKRRIFLEAQSRYFQEAAGVLADLLQAGEPCPVCGSREHPHVAERAENPIDEAKLKELQRQREQAEEKLAELAGRTAALRQETEQKRESVGQMRTRLGKLREQWRRTGKQCGNDVLSRMGIVTEDESCSQERLARLEKQLQTHVAEYTAVNVLLTEKEEQRAQSQNRTEFLRREFAQAEQSFQNALSEHGFTDIQDYRESRLSPDKEQSFGREVENYGGELKSAKDRAERSADAVADLKPVETEPLVDQKEMIQRAQESVLNRQKQNFLLLQSAGKLRKSMEQKQEKLQKLGESYGIVKDLDSLASGNNSKRLVFEQYVLAGYFEEILEAANLRLRKLTSGRYELSRVEEIGDGRSKDNLEMRVLDHYTGRYRPVKTLSGGELFKASLSLALGLSDVIQQKKGGITVECLFVDEGFGALDRESIEQACLTLRSLSLGSCMIGIISHVPELKEQIENRLVVRRTGRGSYVECLE